MSEQAALKRFPNQVASSLDNAWYCRIAPPDRHSGIPADRPVRLPEIAPLTARTADVALATLIESRPTRSSGTQSPNAPRGGITPSAFCAAIPPNGGTIRPLAQGRLPARLPLTDQQVCGVAHHRSLARASPACRSCLDRSVCVWHSCSSDAGRVSGGRQGSKQSSNSRQFRRLQNPGGHRGPSGCCGHRCRGQAHRRRYRCPGRVHVTRKHGPAVYLAANIAPARRSTTRKFHAKTAIADGHTAFVIAPT